MWKTMDFNKLISGLMVAACLISSHYGVAWTQDFGDLQSALDGVKTGTTELAKKTSTEKTRRSGKAMPKSECTVRNPDGTCNPGQSGFKAQCEAGTAHAPECANFTN